MQHNNQKLWRRVYPEMFIWKNINTGDTVEIRSNDDAGIYSVTRTHPGVSGIVTTFKISPNIIDQNKIPVGQYATEKREEIIESEDYEYGTFQEALNIALKYMQTHEGYNG